MGSYPEEGYAEHYAEREQAKCAAATQPKLCEAEKDFLKARMFDALVKLRPDIIHILINEVSNNE